MQTTYFGQIAVVRKLFALCDTDIANAAGVGLWAASQSRLVWGR